MSPLWERGGGLGAAYDDLLRLIGKRLVNFLLMLIEYFSIRVKAEALPANIGSKSAISLHRGLVDPKFQVEEVAPTNHSFSQKTGLNDLSYVLFCFVTIYAFDGQTDRQTAFSSLDCI